VFDAEKHKYYLNGEELISVTTVLRHAGLFSYYGSDGGMAADRGTNIHLVTDLYDKNVLDMTKIENPLIAPLECWKKFRSDTKLEVLDSEQPVCNVLYRYAGMLDRRVMLNGREAVIDIKSGIQTSWHSIQTILYAKCFDRPLRRFCLYLGDSAYKLVPHDNDQEDWAVARACLTIVAWKKKVGALKS